MREEVESCAAGPRGLGPLSGRSGAASLRVPGEMAGLQGCGVRDARSGPRRAVFVLRGRAGLEASWPPCPRLVGGWAAAGGPALAPVAPPASEFSLESCMYFLPLSRLHRKGAG